jgi:hypothetical protein
MLVLEEIYLSHKNEYSEVFNLRIQRGLSWLRKSVQLDKDWELKFISLWASLQAVYMENESAVYDKGSFNHFIDKVIAHDVEFKLDDVIWYKYNSAIKLLLINPYIYQGFWDFKHGKVELNDWKLEFDYKKKFIQKVLDDKNSKELLRILFECFSTIHKQLVSGGSTSNSSIMRKQLKASCNILAALNYNFMLILLENKECIDSDKPYYPIVQIS